MTESELSELLAYLFPDMHPEMALFPYSKKSFKDKVSLGLFHFLNKT